MKKFRDKGMLMAIDPSHGRQSFSKRWQLLIFWGLRVVAKNLLYEFCCCGTIKVDLVLASRHGQGHWLEFSFGAKFVS